MPARVMLEIVEGKLAGKKFLFAERTSCIIGRGEDCEPQLPDDEDHARISRNHCLLDINPPDVRIRDFGSLNGTFVNGKRIGQRSKKLSADEGAALAFAEHDLKHGDEIRLCGTVLRMNIQAATVCAGCGKEIPEALCAKARHSNGVYECVDCRKKAKAPAKPDVKTPAPARTCEICGKDVSKEAGSARPGEYVCSLCRSDPIHVAQHLLRLADTGAQSLHSIQGYTLLKELGRGGMGAVYLARRNPTEGFIAFKALLPKVAADAAARIKFQREVDNAKALNHPNIVRVHDHGASNGTFFFVCDYCEGGSLDRLLAKSGGRVPLAQAVPIIFQVLDALEYCHHAEIPHIKLANGKIGKGRGIVHRDLTPDNIFFTTAKSVSVVKIGDFGLAKAFDTAGLSGHTRTGESSGKPRYMPRQQVTNFKYAQPDVDVWAAAACFYEMLTGLTPRDFPARRDPWYVVLQEAAIPIRKRMASIPAKLAAVIDQALLDQPSIGIKSAAEFKRAIEKAL